MRHQAYKQQPELSTINLIKPGPICWVELIAASKKARLHWIGNPDWSWTSLWVTLSYSSFKHIVLCGIISIYLSTSYSTHPFLQQSRRRTAAEGDRQETWDWKEWCQQRSDNGRVAEIDNGFSWEKSLNKSASANVLLFRFVSHFGHHCPATST